ncbi:MAG: tRNA epoxyqueuosine(34) reductase QueG [bacterium]
MKNPPIVSSSQSGILEDVSSGHLAQAAKDLARSHGFDLAGIAPPDLGTSYHRYREWISNGYAGEMSYLTRRPEVRKDLRQLWPETRSVLVAAMRYAHPENPPADYSSPGFLSGKIARYAHGGDYHKFIKKRLTRVLRALQEIDPAIEGRSYVDTGPVLERDLAVRCGLGWKGKNSLLLHRELGSYFFLGTLLLNRKLPADPPMEAEHCGTCDQCMVDCPTGAIVKPGVIDARRCISYLTIELRGPMPRELRPLVGDYFFGCDICQEVCPWNDGAPAAIELRFRPRPGTLSPDLNELLLLDEEGFKTRFQGSALMRARYDGFLRNVAVAIGNSGGETSLYVLAQTLHHAEPLARGHAAWALGQIGARLCSKQALSALEARLFSEKDTWVLEEIELALGKVMSSWHHQQITEDPNSNSSASPS